jgi:hypothetical protein
MACKRSAVRIRLPPPVRSLGEPRAGCVPPGPFEKKDWFVDLKGKAPGNDSGAFLLWDAVRTGSTSLAVT